MLKLQNTINGAEGLREITFSPNFASSFNKQDLSSICNSIYNGYEIDLSTMKDSNVLHRHKEGIRLATQVVNPKTFPWTNCSNTIFPVVSIASLQFQATAYPALINGGKLVKFKLPGLFTNPEVLKETNTLEQFFSWQLLDSGSTWEEDMDRMILYLSITGTAFKKIIWNSDLDRPESIFRTIDKIVVNAKESSIEEAYSKTEIFFLSWNDYETNVRSGLFSDTLNFADFATYSDSSVSLQMRETHTWLDLDGDGYEEPYIITWEYSTQTIVRMQARWSREADIATDLAGKVVKINADEWFLTYKFIPHPDNVLYGLGFYDLLSSLSESISTTINQLLDSGTLANSNSGFIGKGAKFKGGTYNFAPFEWKIVDTPMGDLKNSIFPLPVNSPSVVLFNLLSLLVNYVNRLAGVTDMAVGENPGQNTPAETSRTMLSQGQKIYSAVFKRIWKAMKKEFYALCILNAKYLKFEQSIGDVKISNVLFRTYSNYAIPQADPFLDSDSARFAKLNILRQIARSTPGYNIDAVETLFLESLNIGSPDKIYEGMPEQNPTPDIKLLVQNLKNQGNAQEWMFRLNMLKMQLQAQADLSNARVKEIFANIDKTLKSTEHASAKVSIEALRAQMEVLRERDKSDYNQAKLSLDSMQKLTGVSNNVGSGTSELSNLRGLDFEPNDQSFDSETSGITGDGISSDYQ
jgi:chaperonin GroES